MEMMLARKILDMDLDELVRVLRELKLEESDAFFALKRILEDRI